MPKILLVIPTDGGIHEKTAVLASFLSRRDDVVFTVAKARPHDYARNTAVRMFLEHKDFTHLLFIDSDIETPLDCIDRLLALNAPIATGCYPVTDFKGRLQWALLERDKLARYHMIDTLPQVDKPFEIDACGAGCLLIQRIVFDMIQFPWFKWTEEPNGQRISEDVFFCQKCNNVGLKVKADPTIICNHFKEVNLTSLMRQAQAILNNNEV